MNETMASINLRANITRVRDASGFVGTVLYLGPVASAKSPTEIYAGIAWDDVTRGKHDGSVICRTTNQLVRHFKCGPTQGSFLRLSKVDAGVSLSPELMRSRYVKPDAELVAPDNLLPHVARTSGGRDKPIEFLGELKIRNRQQLEVVEDISLRMLGIARPCCEDDGSDMVEFNQLKGIDLAGNLLSDWQDVLTIMRQFPKLESISLASNRINDLASASLGEFSLIRSLNLNNCNICTFKTVELVGVSMPNLEELCVAHCKLADIECYNLASGDLEDEDKASLLERLFQNLILLDLSDCNLTSWESILQFRKLPKLESLILNDNAIDSILAIPDFKHGKEINESKQTDQAIHFESLTSLQLASTLLSSWSSVDHLNNLSSLRSLRLRNTPLTSLLGVGEVRSTVIARLPSLEYFNASPIPERERVEAERRYVSTVARELLLISSEMTLSDTISKCSTIESNEKDTDKIDSDKTADDEVTNRQVEIFVRHPRFKSLVSKHRDTMMSLSSSNQSGNEMGSNHGRIGEDVINVTIRSMAASSCDAEPLRKRLPRSLKVGRIKAMCARAFAIEIDLQILHFRIEGDPFPTELDDADHTLSYFGVSDGAEILVNEVDVEALERENTRRADEHSRLVKEQEQHVSVLQSMQKKDRVNTIAADISQKL